MKSKSAQSQQDLTAALRALRLLVKEAGGNYLAALQADVARVEQIVNAATAEDLADRRRLIELRAMLKWVGDLEIKPQKGRRRDLKKLDDIIARLSDVVDNW